MCNYCNAQLYVKVQRFLRPVLAPLTRAEELMDEYTNLTGMAFVPLEKRYCPVCGEKLNELRECVPTILDCGGDGG